MNTDLARIYRNVSLRPHQHLYSSLVILCFKWWTSSGFFPPHTFEILIFGIPWPQGSQTPWVFNVRHPPKREEVVEGASHLVL